MSNSVVQIVAHLHKQLQHSMHRKHTSFTRLKNKQTGNCIILQRALSLFNSSGKICHHFHCLSFLDNLLNCTHRQRKRGKRLDTKLLKVLLSLFSTCILCHPSLYLPGGSAAWTSCLQSTARRSNMAGLECACDGYT